ncbi:rRNA maturation RNase YbeY [Wohlfahrtiimonas chitiniclastica]|uniref:rRNA maturation RNase YbeY n=1 Tax=Wohlfahrtiimonas chitiniclastica TaxID=400946 RepID=UPI001BD04B27|nr:rRNA maturation RNase YbeY [Wohlfahrtiimonas chitiniclastica]MBS7817540.1 rRNA maturation RNase YbeY [Wohlfahrtiimonas chitiniclastica]MBS7821310.1 rRNA maturation RNase YbeY [Wohlfahrtiimonas chitiniclastica]MBS7823399.1 rRNA maturation RNase YbeY [Wohlfahrtiimonas chitiniclastica]MBS7831213.1 rRNA maturation RNase YbeY [Wohlfahrtiimonas chitiniclastica]MBS7833180.1 rRNA maturation RNase YbeY [Wohlfahrtiimonas chitiniclastica]
MSDLVLDVQNASTHPSIPNDDQLAIWVNNALSFIAIDEPTVELTIRFADDEEIQALNHTYRAKDKPTNVLSFPSTCNLPESDVYFLGDLIICLSVVEAEAIEQEKTFDHHLAHMVTHGVLHLLGYDHIIDEEAEEMESLEIEILEALSIKNPYEI